MNVLSWSSEVGLRLCCVLGNGNLNCPCCKVLVRLRVSGADVHLRTDMNPDNVATLTALPGDGLGVVNILIRSPLGNLDVYGKDRCSISEQSNRPWVEHLLRTPGLSS